MTNDQTFRDSVATDERWVLGLPATEPEKPKIFTYPAFERTLAMLSNLVDGHDALHVVAGERGSGKTALLGEFLRQSGKPYSRCRITVSENRVNGRHIPIASTDRPAYLIRFSKAPVVLIDDAHALNHGQLDYLLRAAESAARRGRIRSMVLFGVPDMYRDIQRCRPSGAKADVINTLYLPPLSETETEAYLQFRFGDTDDDRSFQCSSRQLRTIHSKSGGMPGQIDLLMAQGMASMPRHRNLLRRIFQPGVFRGGLRTPALAGST